MRGWAWRWEVGVRNDVTQGQVRESLQEVRALEGAEEE